MINYYINIIIALKIIIVKHHCMDNVDRINKTQQKINKKRINKTRINSRVRLQPYCLVLISRNQILCLLSLLTF